MGWIYSHINDLFLVSEMHLSTEISPRFFSYKQTAPTSCKSKSLLLSHVKYLCILKRYVTHIGGVISFVTKRYIWVSGIKNVQFIALRNHWMVPSNQFCRGQSDDCFHTT